ncbi:hypothetical protein TNCV_4742291 [Trichonephila clavipes]|nr:hypothetical protein TNCV_4742291 [Trichonephila clavipes]
MARGGLISLTYMTLWKDFPALFKKENSAKERHASPRKASAGADLAQLPVFSLPFNTIWKTLKVNRVSRRKSNNNIQNVPGCHIPNSCPMRKLLNRSPTGS